jgi:hypothetical protein
MLDYKSKIEGMKVYFTLWHYLNPHKAGTAYFNIFPLHVPSLPLSFSLFNILIISVCLDLNSPGKCARDKLIQHAKA